MQGVRLSLTCLALATAVACGSRAASIAGEPRGRLSARPHDPRGPSIERRGRPQVFISHGRDDDILPFAPCGQALAARLTRDGYTVTFEAFAGRHEIPAAIASAAFTWFIGGSSEPGR